MSNFSVRAFVALLAAHYGVTPDNAESALGKILSAEVASSTIKTKEGSWETTGGTALTDDTFNVLKGATSSTYRYTAAHYGRFASAVDPQTGQQRRGLRIVASIAEKATAASALPLLIRIAGILPDGEIYEDVITTGGSIFIGVDVVLSSTVTITVMNKSDATDGGTISVSLVGRSVLGTVGPAATAFAARAAGFDPSHVRALTESALDDAEADDDDDDDDDDEDPDGDIAAKQAPLLKGMGAWLGDRARETKGEAGRALAVMAQALNAPEQIAKVKATVVKEAKKVGKSLAKGKKAHKRRKKRQQQEEAVATGQPVGKHTRRNRTVL